MVAGVIATATFRIRGSVGLSVAANRREQPRRLQTMTWLRLSDSGSAGARSDARQGRCFPQRPSVPVAGSSLLQLGESISTAIRPDRLLPAVAVDLGKRSGRAC